MRQFNTKDYNNIKLHKDGVRTIYLVHRLVATAFIPNSNNLPVVNHKDGDKTNNCVDNLEWCTTSDNVRHAIQFGLLSVDQIRENGRKSKDVCAIRVLCEDTNQVFASVLDAEKYLNIVSIHDNIHKYKRTHNGRGWLFKIISEEYYQEHKDDYVDIDACEEIHNQIRSKIGQQGKPVKIYCVERDIIYGSIKQAAEDNGMNLRSIQFALKEHRKTKGLTFQIIKED